MNKNTEEISHELGSERARRYVERQKALENYISGVTKDSAEDATDFSINEFNNNDMNAAAGLPSAAVVEEAPAATPAAPVEPKQVQQSSGDSIIRIKDMKAPVALTCSFTGKQGRQKKFSVKFNAVSVDVSDEGISLMLNDTVTIEPPMTERMELKYKGKPYRVVFAGGMHRFGPFVNMFFTRVLEEPGSEENKA